VKRMLTATGLRNVPEEAPLVALLEELAREMDVNPGARTRADYLSAQKDVRRVLDGRSGRVSRPRVSAAEKKAAEQAAAEAAATAQASAEKPNDLKAFLEKRGIAS
jgi:hypothetical protein